MLIETDAEQWFVPSARAVWIPAGIVHSVRAHGAVEMKTAFIRPDQASSMPAVPREIDVSPLLRALLLAAEGEVVDGENDRLHAFLTLIKSECTAVTTSALRVVRIGDPRLAPLEDVVLGDPGNRESLDDWARRLAMSPRTLTRRLKRATGMTFLRWRQQVAFVHALGRLGEGLTTKAIALELGYAEPGSFVQAFRRQFGVTPQAFGRRSAVDRPERPD